MFSGALRAPWRARASFLGASLACAALASFQSAPLGAREDPLARLEGPPESGVTLRGSEAALKELAAGDAAWKEGARERAFDAWRQAIEVSLPLGVVVAPPPGPSATDVDGTLARRAEDVATSVIRRLNTASAADRAAWRERFESLAALSLQGIRADEAGLVLCERVFPLTRSAARAALSLADVALERGAIEAARTWILRARTHVAEGDAEFLKALDRRAESVATRPDDAPKARVAGLELVRVVELASERTSRGRRIEAAIPGVALAPDGTTWLHSAGRLTAFDGEGRALAAVDVGGTLLAAKVDARPSFSEPGAPWDDAFVLVEGFVALVAGRAREDAGNVLAGFDVRAAPRLAWAWSERGLLRARSGGAVGRKIVGADALLEFQPGPVRAADLLVAHARVWPRADGASPDLDEAAVESWCVGLEPRDGSVRWTRHLASGSTSRGLGRGRMSPPEPTSLPALPLATDGQRVAVDTGLGAIALLDAVDGRVAAIVRTARSAPEGGGSRTLATGGILRAAGPSPAWWFAPAEPRGALLRLRDGPDGDGKGLWTALPLPLEGPRIPISASGAVWTALGGGRTADLRTQDLAGGREVRSVPFPLSRPERGAVAAAAFGSGWIVAAEGRLWRLDPERELALQDELEIGPGSAWRVVAIAARDGLARIAGGERLAFVRAR